jgi:hypothetical protein
MSARQAGVELFRILSLIDAFQDHLLKFDGFFNAALHTWHWEYCVLVICALGATMNGLFQISAIFSIRGPFRAKGLVLFCLTLLIYVRGIAWLWKWFGLGDHTQKFALRYPIVGQVSWFFTAHTIMTLTTPVLNAGMLELSQRAHLFVNIGIIALTIWFCPYGRFIAGKGTNWENGCLLHVVAGYFGVHGWLHGLFFTWLLFFVFFSINRYFMAFDIFEKLPRHWHWAFVNCRLGIVPSRHTFFYVSGGLCAYVCPPNYLWGVFAILAMRSIYFPSSISKVICFTGNKCFMLHLIDCAMGNFGSRSWKVFRSWERIDPPKMAIVNIWLVTFQTLFLGTFLEIYRERILTFAFDLVSSISRWITFQLRPLLVVRRKVDLHFNLSN